MKHVPAFAFLTACLLPAMAAAAPASGLAPTPTPTPASTPLDAPAPQTQAELLLLAIDVPLTPLLIQRVGLTEAIATAHLKDRTALRYMRLRSASALPFFGTPTARATLTAQAASTLAGPDDDEQVRIQAVVSLARGFGPQDVNGVLATLHTLAVGAPARLAQTINDEMDVLTSPTKTELQKAR